jgi:hypothetical protein
MTKIELFQHQRSGFVTVLSPWVEAGRRGMILSMRQPLPDLFWDAPIPEIIVTIRWLDFHPSFEETSEFDQQHVIVFQQEISTKNVD